MNILFTCSGRRNYLLYYFKKALGNDGNIMAADCSPYASTLAEADASFLVPQINDPSYLNAILNICQREKIGMLISLNDFELPLLSRKKNRFSSIGTKVVVSSPKVINLCNDKLATFQFAKLIGLSTKNVYLKLNDAIKDLNNGRISFPLYVKPRFGTGSIGVYKVEDIVELELTWKIALMSLRKNKDFIYNDIYSQFIIQEALPGDEYGADIINDLDGNYKATFVKRKLGMRAGETEKAVTVNMPTLVNLCEKIGGRLGHIGNLDCDFFWDGINAYLLEMNPRFGGGYPFSAIAGAKVPGALIAWAKGEMPPKGWDKIRYGVMASKCDRILLIKEKINK